MTPTPKGPYGEGLEYLEDVLSLITLRLQREVSMTRALRGTERRESFLGLFLTDDEVDGILRELSGPRPDDPEQHHGLDRQIDGLMRYIAERVRVTSALLPPQQLATLFGLRNCEVDLLLYLLAAEVDDRFGRVYGFLHDDVRRRRLSPGLAYRLMPDSLPSLAHFRQLFHASAPLRRHRLITPVANGGEAGLPLMERGFRLEDRVVDFLMGQQELDEGILGLAELVPTWTEAEPDLVAEYERGVTAVAETCALDSPPRPLMLEVAEGGDADLWVAALARRLRLATLELDWEALRGRDRDALRDVVSRSVRESRLLGAVLHVRRFDAVEPEQVYEFGRLPYGHVCFSARRLPDWRAGGLDGIEVRVHPLSVRVRGSYWLSRLQPMLGQRPDLDVDALCARLAERYPFDGREVRGVSRSLEPAPSPDESPHVIQARITDECKRLAGREMNGVAIKVDTEFGFDDLVLPAPTLSLLKELIVQQQHGPRVLHEWELGRKFYQCEGTTALFVGPSGTGKTMASSVVANELGLDLYRVDLSAVVSKYIGETEKNLDRLFSAASRSRVVLFIDEADALFGKRSEIKDAHDRYANIEVSFLLQRMEDYPGIAVLATNLSQNIDDAFFRRIHSVIEFPVPQESDRLRLWQRLGESAAPVADDVDLCLLASRFDLTGGDIKNCILGAAYVAAHEDGPIGMLHLVRAVGREYLKLGKSISKAEFGPFYNAVRQRGVVG